MNRREARSEIFFDHKKMAEIGAAEILASVATASFINLPKIRREFFIGNVKRGIKIRPVFPSPFRGG